MAYVSTYVCDFRDDTMKQPCRMLADAACALCDKHGCSKHLRHAMRVVFAVCSAVLPQPEMPLPNIRHTALPSPVLTFERFQALTSNDKKTVLLDGGRRALTERPICDDCVRLMNDDVDILDSIRAAVNDFVANAKAHLASRAMAAKTGSEAA